MSISKRNQTTKNEKNKKTITRTVEAKNNVTTRKITNTILAIIYSTALNHFFLYNLQSPVTDNHQLIGLPSLPLKHSSLATLLPHVIYESILISSLSHSSFSSFGVCLHLLKLPLLSTVYRYFKISFTSGICRSLAFDMANYLGQLLIFYMFSPSQRPRTTTRTLGEESQEGLMNPAQEENERLEEEKEKKIEMMRAGRKTYMVLMSLLTWLLVSLIDGLATFTLERSLSRRIEVDVQEYLAKLQLDQYFLLQPSEKTGLTEILRELPAKDRPMIDHQLLAPVVNLPYFFSSAALISLPSDFILLDRLPMLSLNTKSLWLVGMVARRVSYSVMTWFLKR